MAVLFSESDRLLPQNHPGEWRQRETCAAGEVSADGQPHYRQEECTASWIPRAHVSFLIGKLVSGRFS